MMPFIRISPMKSMIDEVISAAICNLKTPKVTVYNYVDFKTSRFSSLGHYMTNNMNGIVDLNSTPSVSGDYSGLNPMGFIWSMKPEPKSRPGCRLLVRDVAESVTFNIEAHDGHRSLNELSASTLLCSQTYQRTYLSDSVERIPVRIGRIRGTLFCPKNVSSCPGVVDLFGMGGGLIEMRAALLASKGFAVLALAFFGYDDLPAVYEYQDMTYFEEAVDFLLTHPKVSGPKVGIMGVSKGAELSCLTALLLPNKIGACVFINGIGYPTDLDVHYKDFYMKGEGYNVSHDLEWSKKGLIFGAYLAPKSADSIFPIERADCEFLLVHCMADYAAPGDTVDVLADRLIKAKKSNFRILRYPNAGHLFEPPYMPLCDSAYIKSSNVLINYGGIPYDHHKAQMHFWEELICFLKNSLGRAIPKSSL